MEQVKQTQTTTTQGGGNGNTRTNRRKDYTKDEARKMLKPGPQGFPKSVCFNIKELVKIAENNKSETITFFFGVYDKDEVPGYEGEKMKGKPVLLLKEMETVAEQGKGGETTMQNYHYVDNGSLCPPLKNCDISREQD